MSAEKLRAFLAVDLPSSVRTQVFQSIAPLRERLDRKVRWVPADNLHLTLKYLGDVEHERLPRLLELSTARLAGLPAFETVLGGLAAVPNARSTRVIWFDVGAGSRELARLARKLDAAASKIDVPRERRVFRAHLTVGRLREPAEVPLAGFVLREDAGRLSFWAREVVLYESRLSSTGSTYVPLAHLPLREVETLPNQLAPEI